MPTLKCIDEDIVNLRLRRKLVVGNQLDTSQAGSMNNLETFSWSCNLSKSTSLSSLWFEGGIQEKVTFSELQWLLVT